MNENEEKRLAVADAHYDGMVDLATRQLAARMGERAVATYELYDYDLFGAAFVSDFVVEFVTAGYATYLVRPENLDEESLLILFTALAQANMRGLPDEARQYFTLFKHLCALYYEQGCLRGVLVDEPDFQQLLLGILAEIYNNKILE